MSAVRAGGNAVSLFANMDWAGPCEESRFLAHVLQELQLNYVMELEEDKKRGAGA